MQARRPMWDIAVIVTPQHGKSWLSTARRLLWIVLLSIPGVAWILTAGDLEVYSGEAVPEGQVLYLLSKLFGLYAFVCMWAQIMYGLLGSDGRATLRVDHGHSFHKKLGTLVLGTVLVHLTLFLAAVSTRTHHFAVNYITPSFADGYYRSIITLGIFALILMAVAVGCAAARKRMPRIWIAGHRLTVLAFTLGFAHGISIGSETRSSPMLFLYFGMAATVVGVTAWRLWRAAAVCTARHFDSLWVPFDRTAAKGASDHTVADSFAEAAGAGPKTQSVKL